MFNIFEVLLEQENKMNRINNVIINFLFSAKFKKETIFSFII